MRLLSSIAAGFTTLVTSFVSEILLPPISLLPFMNRNMDEKFAILRRGPQYHEWDGYNTKEQAASDGAVIMGYGCVLIFSLTIFHRSCLSVQYCILTVRLKDFLEQVAQLHRRWNCALPDRAAI